MTATETQTWDCPRCRRQVTVSGPPADVAYLIECCRERHARAHPVSFRRALR